MPVSSAVDKNRKAKPIGGPAVRQESIENWEAPYETNVGKLAKAHPIANVIGLGLPALVQSAAGGVGNAASIMATPDTRPAAERIESAVQGSNLVRGIKQVTTPPPAGQMRVALTPEAQAAPPPEQKMRPVKPIGGTPPMLASHRPGEGDVDAVKIESMRKPLTAATSTAPAIGGPVMAPRSGGTMSVEGGGTASIDSQGNIKRGPGWERGTGSVTVMPSSPTTSTQGAAPIGGGDKWSFLEDGSAFGAAKAGVARKLGYVPVDYDSNPGKYDTIIASQGADFARAESAVPVAEIGAGADRYAADQGLAAHGLSADATVKAAEIGAEGREISALSTARQKILEEGAKDAKEMQKTFFDSIKDLTLPAGWEGKHMEIAKILAQDQDPNVDLGVYYSPGSNRQGIAAKKSVFEPLLSRYLQAGMPAADAHANAYRDLQEIEKQKGVALHKPFPNLDRLYKNDRKQPDALTLGE